MNYQNIPQENKAEILEHAVLNETPERLAETYRELGDIEMTARALGLACRFCGVEKVRTLIGCGATFDIPRDEAVERRYHCYSGAKYDNYRSNYALYLLKIFRQIKGATCCKGLKLVKQAATDNKKYLPFLPDSERLEVLRCLCENKDRLSFEPSEMLYYAAFARDNVIVDELKRLGVGLSEIRVKRLTEGGQASDSYWYEWGAMMSKLSDEDYLPVMRTIAAELGGKPFHCTGKIYDITKKRLVDAEKLEFFRENFKTERLNKTDVIRGLINYNAADSLSVIEKLGWLDNPKRRDEMIEYAQRTKNTECVAWLLDFKNRTADLAAEQAKAEKKMERELNANPNSVTMLKKLWSYKKRERGDGLVITEYKGTATEVTVPEMIGKSAVVEIGNGAFAGTSGMGAGSVITNVSHELQAARRRITKITLPKTITQIGRGAFGDMMSLETIEIPDGVKEIEPFAFDMCTSLTEIVVPRSVRRIGMYAFAGCTSLKRVKLCEGVIELGGGAFSRDLSLETLELPKSLKRLIVEETRYNTIYAIDGYLSVTVICPEGSCAEKYCKEHGIKFRNV